MKKIYSLLVAMLLIVTVASAQESTFKSGDKVISASIGFGSSYYGFPVSLSYEHGVYDINDQMSIGATGTLAYGWKNRNYSGYDYYKYSAFVIAVGANYHYQIVKNLDLYAGLQLGYRIGSKRYQYTYTGNAYKESWSAFYYAFSVGARYYFNPNWAVFAEAGYSVSYFRIGANYKF